MRCHCSDDSLLNSAKFPRLFCTFYRRSQTVGATSHLITFLFFITYPLNISDIVLPPSLQYFGFMCCVLIVGSFLWCDVRLNPMIPTTPPSHIQKQRQVWKWGQTSCACFLLLSSHVLPPPLSLPTLPFPSCSPANSSSLQVKLISLQVDWVILCLLFCWGIVLFVCQVMFGINWAGCVWFLSGDY